ncbi:heme-binding protein [Hydrogenophaga sp. PAMC20947]|uniref:GlcG/HbpS family heme-binding protein n=1 Tax=Hydrogenophaga sp. PAMC20947 TaxID=2565558 RepID=UPI00109DE347|nr:heme-binding protein [Hydrogenophaga sp. PAMC20947]QCB46854.1 heme-binding protein [Hydrogenophaga sp. PAMC20947]
MSETLCPLQVSLSLSQANTIIETALATGRAHNMQPLAVAVLDVGAHLVAFQREDGCGMLRFDIARGKAAAALGMGMSTRMIRDRLAARPAFQSALAAAAQGQFIPVPGGVLILDAGGFAVGAVGISGDTSDKDEFCAITAIQAAGLKSEPEAAAPDWNQSQL